MGCSFSRSPNSCATRHSRLSFGVAPAFCLETFVAKVLFVNPIIRAEDAPRHVPYGIALLSAICDRLGHQVSI